MNLDKITNINQTFLKIEDEIDQKTLKNKLKKAIHQIAFEVYLINFCKILTMPNVMAFTLSSNSISSSFFTYKIRPYLFEEGKPSLPKDTFTTIFKIYIEKNLPKSEKMKIQSLAEFYTDLAEKALAMQAVDKKYYNKLWTNNPWIIKDRKVTLSNYQEFIGSLLEQDGRGALMEKMNIESLVDTGTSESKKGKML